MKRILLILATLTLAAAACGLPAQTTPPPDSAIATASPTIPPPLPTATTPIQPTPTTVQPTATASPEPTATEPAL
ncbi:MAG TPA: thioredoxin-like selenoprotein, partial [Anaerolineaceae bacterium]|nr:thioredoxin-like selenoprotein [Anaerolineaceae bacterium]